MEYKKLGAIAYVQPALPANYGSWSNPHQRGNSDWVYDLTANRWDIADPANPAPWGTLIARTIYPNETQTTFANGFPDFSVVVVDVTCPGSVPLHAAYTFPAGQQLTVKRSTNMQNADRWIANHFGTTMGSVTSYRSTQRFSWHEMEDLQTMLLVPWEIHGNVHHSGGIEVLHSGGIGAPSIDFTKLESRNFGDWKLYRYGEGWIEKWQLNSDDVLRDLVVTFVCDEPDKGPVQMQLESAQHLQQSWGKFWKDAMSAFENYAQGVAGEIGQPAEWRAEAAEVIVYPPNDEAEIEIGVLCDFNLDPEHGIGVRLKNGAIWYVGSGDVAL